MSTNVLQKPQFGARRCVFCGGGPISREHFWPAWAADVLPSGGIPTYDDWYAQIDPSRPAAPADVRTFKRPGGTNTRKLKTVCRGCNSGWMSVQEVTSRPILTALARGEAITLDSGMQDVLTRWIVTKLMAAESDKRGEFVTTSAERRLFKEAGAVPQGTYIWLFRCEAPGWQVTYQRFAAYLSRHREGSVPAHRKNLQQATFGFGNLLVTSVFSRAPGLRLQMNFPEGAAAALWPPPLEPIVWPHPRLITSEEADLIADNISRHVPGVPFMRRKPPT